MAVTRGTFFRRGSALVVGAFSASFAARPQRADAARYFTNTNCIERITSYPRCTSGTTSTCRVNIGFPSCTHSYVSNNSPNGVYYATCNVTCSSGCLGCNPTYNQARLATGNGGKCSCTPLA